MSNNDNILRFMFDATDIRGEIVSLQESYRHAVLEHNYPAGVQQLLGEFVAAVVLLSSTLKFAGSVILQARSDGQIPTIMAECSNDFRVRAIARDAEHATATAFNELLKDGTLAITIDPIKGNRYQGIVPLAGNSLAECLAQYFQQSEQLNTFFWLSADNNSASGFMLQELPKSHMTDANARADNWQHVTHLAATITNEELLSLSHEALLYRLYHEDKVRLFEPRDVRFGCSCSEQRTREMIKSIGQQEAKSILADEGVINVLCEFCNHNYQFDSLAIVDIFNEEPPSLH
jgi:molecular chaperone Hsp33